VINGSVLVHCRVIPSFWAKTAQKRGITRQSVAAALLLAGLMWTIHLSREER